MITVTSKYLILIAIFVALTNFCVTAQAVLQFRENKVIDKAAHIRTAYSLDQCYLLALEKNISLQQAKNKVNANIIDQKTVQNKLLPSVSYNIGHYFSFGKNIDPVTNIFTYQSFSGGYTSVNLQLQLFDGFSRVNAVKQSTYLIQSSEYAKKRKELEILSNITLTYARVLFDKEQLEVVKSNMASTYKQIESVNEKIKVGRTTKYEAYIFNARLNTERANEVSIRNDLSAGLQELKNILNLPSGILLILPR
jgi:outer membrane protein